MPFKFDAPIPLLPDIPPLLNNGTCEEGLLLLCEDDLLRAIFGKELRPKISMIAIEVTTMPNKVRKFAFLSRFDKILYIMRTDVITITRKRLTINFILTRYICISEWFSNFITVISRSDLRINEYVN